MAHIQNDDPKFQIKVVFELIGEVATLEELSKRFHLKPETILTWKDEFLATADAYFAEKDDDED